MLKQHAIEAKPIVEATLDALLGWAPTRGREGADLRTAIGDVRANLLPLLHTDMIGSALIGCFEQAYWTGISLQQMEYVRRIAEEQTAVSVGAIMTRDTLIHLALSIEGDLIANTTFVNREFVTQVRDAVNEAFAMAEESIADKMDAMTYRALIKVHAAISMYLYATARPLPRMLTFRFNQAFLPTLVLAHRLYADASRADELRVENGVVHPTFARPYGRALSQ